MKCYQRFNLPTICNAAELVVIYCENNECTDADRTANILRNLGHSRILVLEGGWEGYWSSIQGGRP
jgi:3-mercaptopyruvate sulfurtransferase SseA